MWFTASILDREAPEGSLFLIPHRTELNSSPSIGLTKVWKHRWEQASLIITLSLPLLLLFRCFITIVIGDSSEQGDTIGSASLEASNLYQAQLGFHFWFVSWIIVKGTLWILPLTIVYPPRPDSTLLIDFLALHPNLQMTAHLLQIDLLVDPSHDTGRTILWRQPDQHQSILGNEMWLISISIV
jgi:hypothetical protein